MRERRNHYGYGSYRGRSRARTFLKVVIAVLAIVLVLLVAAYFFLQKYMVVTSDGVRFELPFFVNKPTPSVAPTPATAEPTTPVVVTPTPPPEPEYTYSHAAPFPADALDGIKELYAEGGAELEQYTGGVEDVTPIFTMKGADGLLGYVSQLQLAKDIRATAADEAINKAIRTASSGTDALDMAAYLSCFQDDLTPYYRNMDALRTGAGNWRGPGNIRWLSPQSEAAREYLADICGELGQLGFREIILDYAAFPAEGELSWIIRGDRYDEETFQETVAEFYRAVERAVGSRAKLAIVTDRTTLDEGANPTTGQSLEELCRYADRLYVDLEGAHAEDYYEKLREAGMETPEEDLVVIVTEPPRGEAEYSWAILPE